MSIPLPVLDDRLYADLLEEARALIPSLAPQWTNHNPSDPGITLIELFAWLTEMLIYGVNRLPEENTRAFLRLLNGPQWTPGTSLDEDIRVTVLALRRRHRAVTAEDHEVLARGASTGVARALCVPRRNLSGNAEADWLVPREGYVSLVVVPDPAQTGALDLESPAGAPLPSQELLAVVGGKLAAQRLVAVQQVVAPPIYVPIQAEVVVAARPDVPAELLRAQVETALKGYLDTLHGGPDGEGWPFGRDVYVLELYRLLERKVSGVDYVPDITLSSTCPPDAPPRCVPGEELWHDEGDPVGVRLASYHLPWADLDPARIAVGSAFLPVRVDITATAKSGFTPAMARRAVKTAVKRLFHPLYGGPGGDDIWEITTFEIAAALTAIVVNPSIRLAADSSRLFDQGTGVRFKAREMADVTVAAHT